MKIMHVIDHWGLGGAQRAVTSLVRQDSKHRHCIASLYGHHRHAWDLPAECRFASMVSSYRASSVIPWRLRRMIKAEKPDIVHVHLNGSKIMTALAVLGLRPRVPVIWHEHSGVEPFHIYGRGMGRLLLWAQRRLLAKVAGVVANSAATKRYCRSHLGVNGSKLKVIYCPVDCEEIRGQADRTLEKVPPGADVNQEVVGFVGRLANQKGLGDLMAIAEPLLSHRPNCQIWIVGDGPKRRRLEETIAAKGLAHRIILWGKRGDVFTIMSKMSVILMPSSFEPFGLVALEAFILQKPVIAYDVDGLSEALRMNGLGIPVPPGDRGAFLEKTMAVLNEGPRISQDKHDIQRHSEIIISHWDSYYGEIARAPQPPKANRVYG